MDKTIQRKYAHQFMVFLLQKQINDPDFIASVLPAHIPFEYLDGIQDEMRSLLLKFSELPAKKTGEEEEEDCFDRRIEHCEIILNREVPKMVDMFISNPTRKLWVHDLGLRVYVFEEIDDQKIIEKLKKHFEPQGLTLKWYDASLNVGVFANHTSRPSQEGVIRDAVLKLQEFVKKNKALLI